MTTAERIVWLDKGEAYFQVKHDAAHPFVVMIGRSIASPISARNSSFAAMPDDWKWPLLQGRVRFDAPTCRSPSQTALLTPGDVATRHGGFDVGRRRSRVQELANELSWRHGVLVFDHTTLADAAAEFNRYNREKIVIADPAAAQLDDRRHVSDQTMSKPSSMRRARCFGLHVDDQRKRDRDLALNDARIA